ncbi:hypothetical protein D4764_02G0011890 [Takifugu flavidus]|uniref:Uncharacterized protein n=1 Tax=Takifugu flavidus TaxID=433684 RepID=A0A5C6NN74_9TELE|nr:hypothetical protein D4764_02G0011890 [Takifugu flavidus]
MAGNVVELKHWGFPCPLSGLAQQSWYFRLHPSSSPHRCSSKLLLLVALLTSSVDKQTGPPLPHSLIKIDKERSKLIHPPSAGAQWEELHELAGLESPEALTEQLSQDGNWEHKEQQVLRGSRGREAEPAGGDPAEVPGQLGNQWAQLGGQQAEEQLAEDQEAKVLDLRWLLGYKFRSRGGRTGWFQVTAPQLLPPPQHIYVLHRGAERTHAVSPRDWFPVGHLGLESTAPPRCLFAQSVERSIAERRARLTLSADLLRIAQNNKAARSFASIREAPPESGPKNSRAGRRDRRGAGARSPEWLQETFTR